MHDIIDWNEERKAYLAGNAMTPANAPFSAEMGVTGEIFGRSLRGCAL